MKLHNGILAGIAICVSAGLAETKILQQDKDGYKGVQDTQICDSSMIKADKEFGTASHNVSYEKIHLHRC